MIKINVSFYEACEIFGISDIKRESRTRFDWFFYAKMNQCYRNAYFISDVDSRYKRLRDTLANSELKEEDNLYFFCFEGTFLVSTTYFIDNWEWFEKHAAFCCQLISENGRFFLEFTDDRGWCPYTNFVVDGAFPHIPLKPNYAF